MAFKKSKLVVYWCAHDQGNKLREWIRCKLQMRFWVLEMEGGSMWRGWKGGGVPCGGGGAILVKVHSGDAFGQHGFVRTCLKNFNGPDQISLPLSSLSRG